MSKKEVGKLALLKYLSEQDGYVCKESVLKHFTISLSTLKRYISSMNEDLKQFKEFNHIRILDRNGGFCLENPSPFSEQYVLKKMNFVYHTKSLQFQLFQKVFSYSVTSLTGLKTSLSISQPYLYHLLFNANLFLAPFRIKLDYSMDSDSVIVSGNSTTIRLFETYFFWSVNQGVEWPFDTISMDEIYAHFSAEELDTIFSASYSKQLKYLYSIAVIYKLHPLGQELDLNDSFKETMRVFQTGYDLSHPLERLLLDNQTEQSSQYLENERLFFNFISRVFSSYRDTATIQVRIGNQLLTLDNELIAYCKKLLKELILTFPKIKTIPEYNDFHPQFLYFFSLYFANVLYIQFDSSHLQEFMVINPDINTVHSNLLEQSKHFFDTFLKKFPLPTNQPISDFHLTLAYGLIYYFTSKIEETRLSIYVHFSKNMFGSFYIEAELYKLFGRENILVVDKVKEADIIISDFYEDRYKKENYFYFDDVQNKKHWRKLYSFVHEHQPDSIN
ncbi:helix-turn-helix domain-containing protein [Enterococcus faecalis]|uniref:helix-turn-helix domain-containing protein n=1 Tax=Enterococcus faecalis TaxID=1351 RepID=UPI0035CBC035